MLGETEMCLFGEQEGTGNVVDDTTACGDIKAFTALATDCVTDVGSFLSHSYKLYIGSIADVEANRAIVLQTSEGQVEGNTAIVLARVEPGIYTLEFVFTDNCGNSTLKRKEYTFKDCRKPTPYLLNGIAIEIMSNTKQIDVWANDFNQGSYDNCSIPDSLKFRIWHSSLGFNPPVTAQGVLDSLPLAITFGCNQLGRQVVRIYVVDEAGNFDFASTYTQIQDNMRACQSGEDGEDMVAGEVLSFSGESIEGVNIMVNGASDTSMTTEADGHFQFMLPKNGDYTITPEKNENPLNGVSTFDLVLISKHILGISTFDSPYKYIAADINKSGSITAFDLVQLRQLILNISAEFPNNKSWRFLDKNYNFTTNNPASENFDEFININNLTENQMNTDFVGAKIGDINGNALTNSLLGAESRSTFKTFKFNVNDQLIKEGQKVKVDFRAANIASVEGYQFTMKFNGLVLKEVIEGVAKVDNFNIQLASRGVLTTSWNGKAKRDDILFTLTFKAGTNGLLSDLLSINSDYIIAEAYDNTGELLDVQIDFKTMDIPLVFELNQNSPNPFKEETVIGFTLPEAAIATLKVLDVQGKVLKTIQGDYAKGYNQINLNVKNYGATGVLYYQLESANNVANKKMIVIE